MTGASVAFNERVGVGMTLRGVKHDGDTLDMTRVRFSVQQMMIVIGTVFMLGGLWSVVLWRINDIAERMKTMEHTVHTLQEHDAAQEAILRGSQQR